MFELNQMKQSYKIQGKLKSNSASSKMSSSLSPSSPSSANNVSAKVTDYRKNTKPLMEKRRRERINKSLEELKNIILDQTNHNPIRNHKLEKADILEMTVKHLRNIQIQKIVAASAIDPTVTTKYKQGYTECVQECINFMNTNPNNLQWTSNSNGQVIDQLTKQRLIMNLVKQFQAAGNVSMSNAQLPKIDFQPINDDTSQQLPQQEACSRRNSVSPISGTSECSSHSVNNYYSLLNHSSMSSTSSVSISNDQGMVSPGVGGYESFNEQIKSEPSSPKNLNDKESGKVTWRPWATGI